ncbi:MAG: alpha-L-fucosidase [Bifidobacteriaceae bacterium]|jgi:hypothetical protein|nr:alpha-L-fucosidase [Bifidobacteriaceae bacterium]
MATTALRQAQRPVLRQVHLDFHTSEAITQVADQFDASLFADTLAEAHVNSINVFAKCGHGYSYYPTAVGTIHPGLQRDLLGEMLEALHARGIKAPVYVSVNWDDLAARQHPEWLAIDRRGRELTRPPFWGGANGEGRPAWTALDLASGYADYVIEQIDEIGRLYHPDGLWLDIVSVMPNYAPAGLDRMVAAGIDPEDQAQVESYYRQVRLDFISRVGELMAGYNPAATIVHNHTTDAWLGETIPWQYQVDVESLPTDGAWGYMHYPIVARYARTFGRPIVGMTGRFHRSWGDFGGLKTADQLDFEVATIHSAGGSPSIGDQLDPSGVLDPAVYRTIGRVFAKAQALTPWLAGFTPLTEAAILAQWNYKDADPGRLLKAPSPGTQGAAQVLLEQAVQFDLVDETNLSPGSYALIVVPDDANPTDALVAKLAACRAAGARLVSAGGALLDRLDGAPAYPARPASTVPTYRRLDSLADAIVQADPAYPYVGYGEAWVLQPSEGASTAGTLLEARFNRTWQHLISHAQAPASDRVAGPLAVWNEGWGHLASPVFSDYAAQSYWIDAALAGAILNRMLPQRLVRHDGPPNVEATLHQGPTVDGIASRALHLVAYQPRRSVSPVPRLDKTHPLAGFAIDVQVPGRAIAAYVAPSREPVTFTQLLDGIVRLEPQVIAPQTVIAIEYEA